MGIILEDMKTTERYSALEVLTIIALKDAVKVNKVISYLNCYSEKGE